MTALTKFAILDLLPREESVGLAEALRKVTSRAVFAGENGFAAYWYAQHHGWPLDSAAFLLGQHLCREVPGIRIGVAGMLLEYCSPRLVADEYILTSLLTEGRFDFGICRGRIHGDEGEGFTRYLNSPESDTWGAKARDLLMSISRICERHEMQVASPIFLGSGGRTYALSEALTAPYCHSLFHAIASGNNGEDTLPAAKIAYLAIGFVCAATVAEAYDDFDEGASTFVSPNVVGDVETCMAYIQRLVAMGISQSIVLCDLSMSRRYSAELYKALGHFSEPRSRRT